MPGTAQRGTNPSAMRGFTIVIDASELKKADAVLMAMPGNVRKEAQKQLGILANSAVTIVMNETPKGKTTDLADSTTQSRISSYKYHIIQTAAVHERLTADPFYYGRSIRAGAKPPVGTKWHLARKRGWITPRLKKALWWPGLPHPILYTQHGGIPKSRTKDYVASSLKRIGPAIDLMADQLFANVTTTVNKTFRVGGKRK